MAVLGGGPDPEGLRPIIGGYVNKRPDRNPGVPAPAAGRRTAFRPAVDDFGQSRYFGSRKGTLDGVVVVLGVVRRGRGRGRIEQGKQRCLLVLYGVLLGPIGLILSLVVSGDPAVVERKKIEGGGYRRCEKCAELIRSEARKCRFCGSDIDGSVKADGSGGDQAKVGGTSQYDEYGM